MVNQNILILRPKFNIFWAIFIRFFLTFNTSVILDNASFHKRKDFISKISEELPNFILEFLPAYSPDYNIIKLVWYSCKEYIAHRLFQSVDELKSLLDRLLNQGELIIKWHRQIKNKGNNHYVAT